VRVPRVIARLAPRYFYVNDEPSYTARQFAVRVAVGTAWVIVTAVAVGLLSPGTWADVLSGALLAWGVSVLIWAIASFRAEHGNTKRGLELQAQFDVLHVRLNQIADAVGARVVDVNSGGMQAILDVREERLAHLWGLEELRDAPAIDDPEALAFWQDDPGQRT
jgi:hypothetical protein